MVRNELFTNADRSMHSGLSKVMVYPHNANAYPWPGATRMEASYEDSDVQVVYQKGIPVAIHREKGRRISTLYTLGYPSQVDDLAGLRVDDFGIIYDELNYEPEMFHLCYRTEVDSKNYRLHVLFNQSLTDDGDTHDTHTEEVNPSEFKWEMTGIPMLVLGRHVQYLVLDSRQVPRGLMALFESGMYGGDGRQPSINHFVDTMHRLNEAEGEFRIINSNDDEWTIAGPNGLIDVREGDFRITDIPNNTTNGIYTLREGIGYNDSAL